MFHQPDDERILDDRYEDAHKIWLESLTEAEYEAYKADRERRNEELN